MKTLILEVAHTSDTHRYDDDNTATTQFSRDGSNPAAWRVVAWAKDKAEMLDKVLEMLNNEELDPNERWVRLATVNDDHTKTVSVEVF